MKIAKILLVAFLILSAGGMVIGEVGAGTPMGNVATLLTVAAVFLAAKRLARQ